MFEWILVILALAVLIFFTVVRSAHHAFISQVKREVAQLFQARQPASPEVITEQDLENLPAALQKHLRQAGIVGQARVDCVRLKQKGSIRTKQDQAWMPFEAEEYYTVNPPAFLWFARVKAMPFVSLTARDRYADGKGNMLIKLLSLFSVADGRGAELDQGTLMRFLNEIMWFPSAALSDYLKWEEVDEKQVKVSMTYKGVSATANLTFNEQGEILNFSGTRYCDVGGGKFSLETWSTPVSGYKDANGYRLPLSGAGVWNLSSGDFCYVKLDVTEIEFNRPQVY